MNCVIIEDEDSSIEQLESYLEASGKPFNIQAKLDSIEEAVPWLKNNETDLIFLDIHLADGLSFEIFDHVQIKTPVIFTTSYDQYITKAFELNSISYLLKPFDFNSLNAALQKFDFLHSDTKDIQHKLLPIHREFQKRFLVTSGASYTTIMTSDVACLYVQNKAFLFIATKNKQQYLYDSTLEIVEQRLDPSQFFRINRQCIVNIDTIKQVHKYDTRGRLKLETEPASKEDLIVSISRASAFKQWLDR
jgi:DNA-binding LytR/AlgR family response regulator